MSSLLEVIDHVADLLDRLRLDTAARSRGAVVVEGPVDATVLREAFASDGITAFPVSGRNNVLRAADQLAVVYLPGVLCVADADFDDEVETRAAQWFVVFTDNADIEAMIVGTAALERVIEMWGSRTKISAFGGVARLREVVTTTVEPISVLRRQNAIRGVGIRFDAVNLHDVVAKQHLTLNLTGLVARLSNASGVTQRAIRDMLAENASVCPHTGETLVNGEDCLTVVDVALRRAIGNCTYQQVKPGLARNSVLLTVRATDIALSPFSDRFRRALARALAGG